MFYIKGIFRHNGYIFVLLRSYIARGFDDLLSTDVLALSNRPHVLRPLRYLKQALALHLVPAPHPGSVFLHFDHTSLLQKQRASDDWYVETLETLDNDITTIFCVNRWWVAFH